MWNKFVIFSVFFFQFFLLSFSYGKDLQDENFSDFFQSLTSDPVKVMNQLPYRNKNESNGIVIFKEKDLQDFVLKKDAVRKNFCQIIDGHSYCLKDRKTNKLGIAENDYPPRFFDSNQKHLYNLNQIESRNLLSASLNSKPWSGDYWALALGSLAYRYQEGQRLGEYSWQELFDFQHYSRPAQFYIDRNQVNRLSPAEKYDLLVGDYNFSLTNKMWASGKEHLNIDGTVDSWMGLCHGWAVASYLVPKPIKSVTALAADGKTFITFYPSDLKGLATLLWATAYTKTKFLGGRCNIKNPHTDTKTGRVLEQDCFDSNPGTWHQVVVSKIGANKQSFVMDATYDFQVWNHPVVSYSYRYFNPQTGHGGFTRWQDAKILKRDFTQDIFKGIHPRYNIPYRDSRTVWVVGVEMDVTYVVETISYVTDYEGEITGDTKTIRYRYDLEIDNNGSILGGEWYANAHPDFLWTIEQGFKAKSQFDNEIYENWNTQTRLPISWQNLAKKASQLESIPLASIVERLIEKSRR